MVSLIHLPTLWSQIGPARDPPGVGLGRREVELRWALEYFRPRLAHSLPLPRPRCSPRRHVGCRGFAENTKASAAQAGLVAKAQSFEYFHRQDPKMHNVSDGCRIAPTGLYVGSVLQRNKDFGSFCEWAIDRFASENQCIANVVMTATTRCPRLSRGPEGGQHR